MAQPEMQTDTIQLQPRDLAALCGLFESRVMTAGHIATLYFDDKREYTKKRLGKLKVEGLIGERRRRVNEPAILFLTRKAFTFLTRAGHLSKYPSLSPNSFEVRTNLSDFTLQHELEIMDVKAAFHRALATSDEYSLAQFNTWPQLYEFRARRSPHDSEEMPVRPDGFIRIHEKEPEDHVSEHPLFLEVDRSTESQDKLAAKAGCYLDYYTSGGFAKQNGATFADYRLFPFRVLMVLKTAERRNNTTERLLQNDPPILRQVWLSTMSEVVANPLGRIWIRPSDYREATQNSPFDVESQPPKFAYSRNVERERWVESKVKKICIFNGECAN